MNLRRLKYFIKIVDIGSLTQAADVLHIAQPALSQQLATLEGEVGQKLLNRTPKGMTPTEAGKTLYRHAQLILRQVEYARRDVSVCTEGLSGQVAVGLAPGTAASSLAMPLLTQVRARHPGIVLCLNENYGTILSAYVMSGRMDMAVLYGGDRVVHGLTYTPLFREGMYLASSFGMAVAGDSVPLSELAGMELFLPRPYNTARQLLDEALATASIAPRVIGEIESVATLAGAVGKGLGSAVLPGSVAKHIASIDTRIRLWKLTAPDLTIPLSHCVSSYLALSESAKAVQAIRQRQAAERREVQEHRDRAREAPPEVPAQPPQGEDLRRVAAVQDRQEHRQERHRGTVERDLARGQGPAQPLDAREHQGHAQRRSHFQVDARCRAPGVAHVPSGQASSIRRRTSAR
jgi:LysR family nitrogen assimilation transcriptional regulator